MTEEQQPTQASEAPVEEPTIQPAPETEPAATVPDWRTALDSAPADELRKHPKFAGVLGSEIARERERLAREEEAAKARRTEEEREAELLRLLEENDETLQERYPKAREALLERQRQRAESDLQRRIGESRSEFAERVGRAYQALPEWQEVIEKHRSELEAAVSGKPEEEAIQAFVVTGAALVGRVKAQREFEGRLQTELEKAKVALKQEIAAEMLAGGAAPDLRKPGGLPSKAATIATMSDEEYARWWENHKAQYG